MAVLSHDDLLTAVKTLVGDRDDDETLNILGDITDTINDSEDWKGKFEENDKMWRTKYKERFFTPDETKVPDTDATKSIIDETEGTEVEVKETYNELFESEVK